MTNTFTVTSNADDGLVADGSIGAAAGDGSNDASGTLRQAVNYANATAGPVTIDFALPAGSIPINLDAPLQPILNSVTINGNGGTIDGNGTRIFFIGVDDADVVANTNFASRIQVNLNGLTLRAVWPRAAPEGAELAAAALEPAERSSSTNRPMSHSPM